MSFGDEETERLEPDVDPKKKLEDAPTFSDVKVTIEGREIGILKAVTYIDPPLRQGPRARIVYSVDGRAELVWE